MRSIALPEAISQPARTDCFVISILAMTLVLQADYLSKVLFPLEIDDGFNWFSNICSIHPRVYNPTLQYSGWELSAIGLDSLLLQPEFHLIRTADSGRSTPSLLSQFLV